MSSNENEGVRATFARFQIMAVETPYTIGAKASRVGEVLISNYPLPANDN